MKEFKSRLVDVREFEFRVKVYEFDTDELELVFKQTVAVGARPEHPSPRSRAESALVEELDKVYDLDYYYEIVCIDAH